MNIHELITLTQAQSLGLKQNTENGEKKPVEVSDTSALKELLSQGEKAQDVLIRGTITDLRTNLISLKLDSGEIFTARTETQLPLSIGETAEFIVTGNDGKIITLKNVPDKAEGGKVNALVNRALDAAGIQKNERNVNIASELLKHNLPINETTIRKYITMSAKYPEVPVKELILLNKNNIPLRDENIKAYIDLTSGNTRLSEALKNEAGHVFERIIQIDDKNVRQALTDELTNALKDIKNTLPDKASDPLKDVGQNYIKASDLTEKPATSGDQKASVLPEIKTLDAASDAKKESDTSFKPWFAAKEAVAETVTEKNIPVEKPAIEKEISDNTFKSENTSPEKAIQDLRLELSLLPENITKENVKALYERIKKAADSLDEISKKTEEALKAQQALRISKEGAEEAAKASQSPKTVSQTIKLMNAINDVFPYLQLPIKLKDENAHGELYVYERKKALKDGENLSALLHLDLEKLGTTDIYVNLSGTSVYTSFTVASETSEKVFAKEMPSLKEALQKKGYELSSEIKVSESENKEDSRARISEFLEAHSPSSVSRYSFDMRA